MNKPKLGFELKRIVVSLDHILPIRHPSESQKEPNRYKVVFASIKEIGVVEPLVVIRERGRFGYYLIRDGHLRHRALQELGIGEAYCVVAIDDESYTFNARVSRLSPIQEHAMIMKAVKSGVSPKRIAAALNKSLPEIRANMSLLKGIHKEAADQLKDKEMSPGTIRILRRVVPVRQIEMAEMMVSTNTFTRGYVEALLLGTPSDQIVNKDEPKKAKGMTSEQIAKMEEETEALERDFRQIEGSYRDNCLTLTLARGYIRRVLENSKVVKYMACHHKDIFTEFEAIASAEGL